MFAQLEADYMDCSTMMPSGVCEVVCEKVTDSFTKSSFTATLFQYVAANNGGRSTTVLFTS